ncbi:hypothetical protein GTR02_15710 [Kineococcus sp. R8]|uniref:TetR/AcrR family transcriptional regulator n=1 Tax=Kineococcus siccus TaxID=2696567 RepID=UPI0014130062|nr:hypothetical protein [Kineococcus siccus]NAZ83266.1 hypothetical protein [Kineococcus siccus]
MTGRWVVSDGLPPPGSSADRLLDSAERLVALDGLQGSSSRAITLAAGHRNSNAIAYHFGDRLGLLSAVAYRRTVGIDRRRVRELADLERDDRTRDPEALVRALVRPFAAELAGHTPSYWARFNEALLTGYPLDALGRFTAEGGTLPSLRGLVRTLAHARDLAAGGREPLASRRVTQVVRMGVTSLACWERDCDAGLLERSSLDALTADLVRTGAAVLTAAAPVTPGKALGTRAPAAPAAQTSDVEALDGGSGPDVTVHV